MEKRAEEIQRHFDDLMRELLESRIKYDVKE